MDQLGSSKTLSIFLLAFIFLCGCTVPDRVNHRNSSANANSIDTDAAAFKSFTSTNSGLQSKIQANTTAQMVLMQQVDDAHEKLRETYFGYSMDDKTWLNMVAGMWKDFGLATNIDINRFEVAKTPADLKNLEPDISNMNILVTNQIVMRIRKIQAIGKVLQALSEGQAALAKQAANQAATNLATLTNLLVNASQLSNTNKNTSTNNSSIANMLLLLQSEVIGAGRQWSQNEEVKSNATALQKLILAQAENSRDPASAYALVAIIGTGLGSNDMVSLDNFITNLQARIISDLPTNNISPHAGASNSSVVMEDSMDFKSHLVMALTTTTPPRSGAPIESASPTTSSSADNYEQAFSNSWNSAYQLVLSLKNDNAIYQKSLLVARLSINTKTANANAENSLSTIAKNIPLAAESIASSANDLQVSLNNFGNILQDTNAIAEFTGLFSSNGGDSSQLLPLLLNAASMNPNVNQFLNQGLLQNTNLVNQWMQIGKDIQGESLAAGARLMQFFYDLSQLQTSLYKENARHYAALGGIGTKEIQRWDWIGDVYDKIALLYHVNWTNQMIGDNAYNNCLFMDSPAINSFQDYYMSDVTNVQPSAFERGYTNVWKGVRILPTVLPTDQIIPSIRILAENAYEHQTASPSTYDPIGLYAQISHSRLNQAIELILRSDFIINYNKQQADVLHRLLLGEIKDHANIVDSIILSTYEANIQLQIGDSKAFHDTGITDADLQMALQTIQAGFIGLIYSKQ